jgi:hypothetical protein
MLKSITTEMTSTLISVHLSTFAKRFSIALDSIRNICLFSEDTIYKHRFINEYMPLLYKKHIAATHSNCVFCNQLIRSSCHKQCFKCTINNYPHCSSLLPGLLNCESIYPYSSDTMKVPWYYAQTCSSFSRLPQENYFRNFNTSLRSSAIFNFEVLESLEKGLLSGEKPCHVCASTDFEIYKRCTGQGDFHAFSPCRKIVDELAEYYLNQSSNSKINTEVS